MYPLESTEWVKKYTFDPGLCQEVSGARCSGYKIETHLHNHVETKYYSMNSVGQVTTTRRFRIKKGPSCVIQLRVAGSAVFTLCEGSEFKLLFLFRLLRWRTQERQTSSRPR